MGLGRRKIRLEDASRWVFNRMAHVYDARPPYPATLVDRLFALSGGAGQRVADLGAGIGHLTLPLAARGLSVSAVEPAKDMLAQLSARAEALSLSVQCHHATAEALPFPDRSADLVLIADALHFLDAELVGREVRRVLSPGGVLAIITCELSQTPFMRAVQAVMQDSAPRRPRVVSDALRQLCALAEVEATLREEFHDETPVDAETLERILRSISFIGPAMNAQIFEAFRARIHAIEEPALWARSFTLHAGALRSGR